MAHKGIIGNGMNKTIKSNDQTTKAKVKSK